MSHSTWFHFVRSPRYFAAVDEIRETHREESRGRTAYNPHPELAKRYGLNGKRDWEPGLNPLGKLPGSVWHLTTEQCIERIVKGWSPRGICVECGTPRVPVVVKEDVPVRPNWDGKWFEDATQPRTLQTKRMGNIDATITGYRCACPEPTSPTRAPLVRLP